MPPSLRGRAGCLSPRGGPAAAPAAFCPCGCDAAAAAAALAAPPSRLTGTPGRAPFAFPSRASAARGRGRRRLSPEAAQMGQRPRALPPQPPQRGAGGPRLAALLAPAPAPAPAPRGRRGPLASAPAGRQP